MSSGSPGFGGEWDPYGTRPAPPPPVPPPPGSAEPPPYRPHPAAVVVALAMPVVLLIVAALPLGVVWALTWLTPAELSPVGSRSPSATEGGPGVGDPYFPDYGSSGYDALGYRIAVSFDPATATLTASTRISARATQRLDSFYVDLALAVNAVTVDGRPASSTKEGFQDVRITPEKPIEAGANFETVVEYSGQPSQVRTPRVTPYLVTGQEWMIAGEPQSSAWWYPANDHPSDVALMDVSIRVPTGLQAVSVGRLESRDAAQEADFDTWRWVSRQPMATYLNFLAIGRFDLDTGVVDGRPYVYAVSQQLSPADRQAAMAALQTSAAVLRTLETEFGPYPFSELGGIVPAHELRFGGLETQTRPIYRASALLDPDYAPELIAHELAHMWFGNNVTLRQWDDIFVNEAYGSYAQWVYTERAGGRDRESRFERTYGRTRADVAFWQVRMIDPGPDRLFDVVYNRGPMTLVALRNVIGAEAFDQFTRDWAGDAGSRSLEEWMIKAQSYSRTDLVPFFQAWIFAPVAPEPTTSNGFDR